MSRLPLEQMMASLRPAPTSESKLGTIAGEASVLVMSFLLSWVGGSDAAVRLGQAGHVGHLLCRLLREQGEQRLDRDPANGGHPPEGRGLAHLFEVLAQEPDRLPVRVGQRDSDQFGERGPECVIPFGRVGEEALFVDVDLMAVKGGHGHCALSFYIAGCRVAVLPTMDIWVGTGIE